EQDKLRARGNAAAEQKDQAARRAAQKAAGNAERAVHDLERKVAELRRALDDPDLYDGSAAKAKHAGKLDKELTAAQRALDAALARWAEVVNLSGRASTS
ncbi:MAG: ABC transporter C-terminal domain-containing protein, partial [Gemmatimonadales bacterium]